VHGWQELDTVWGQMGISSAGGEDIYIASHDINRYHRHVEKAHHRHVGKWQAPQGAVEACMALKSKLTA
jgi:hypothetical protein